jgi:hypothetical protein
VTSGTGHPPPLGPRRPGHASRARARDPRPFPERRRGPARPKTDVTDRRFSYADRRFSPLLPFFSYYARTFFRPLFGKPERRECRVCLVLFGGLTGDQARRRAPYRDGDKTGPTRRRAAKPAPLRARKTGHGQARGEGEQNGGGGQVKEENTVKPARGRVPKRTPPRPSAGRGETPKRHGEPAKPAREPPQRHGEPAKPGPEPTERQGEPARPAGGIAKLDAGKPRGKQASERT